MKTSEDAITVMDKDEHMNDSLENQELNAQGQLGKLFSDIVQKGEEKLPFYTGQDEDEDLIDMELETLELE